MCINLRIHTSSFVLLLLYFPFMLCIDSTLERQSLKELNKEAFVYFELLLCCVFGCSGVLSCRLMHTVSPLVVATTYVDKTEAAPLTSSYT